MSNGFCSTARGYEISEKFVLYLSWEVRGNMSMSNPFEFLGDSSNGATLGARHRERDVEEVKLVGG